MPRRRQLPDLPAPEPQTAGDAYSPLLPDDFPERDAPDLTGTRPRSSRRVPRHGRSAAGGRAAFSLAAPHLVTAGLAWVFVGVMTVIGAPSYPVGLMLVLLVQAAGVAIAWLADLPALARIWFIDLLICAGLLPLLALETSLAGGPYVSLAGGSAGLALLSWVAAMAALVIVAAVAAVATWEAPEQAGLIFIPAALLVPAILGVRHDLSESRALAVVGEVFAIAAMAILVAGLLSPGMRLLTGPAALTVQIVVLWATGRGPSYQATSGDVVPALYATLLVATVALTVLVPIAAYWLRGVTRAMEATGVRRRALGDRR